MIHAVREPTPPPDDARSVAVPADAPTRPAQTSGFDWPAALRRHPHKIGLTGGIGSGKSTVAARLAHHGAGVVDADAIARSVTAARGAALAAIQERFGPDSIDADGALNRAWMRQRVFADPSARAALEAIVHPLVSQITAQRALTLLSQGVRWLVFDVPLLVENPHWHRRVSHVLVVDCDEATQVQRVTRRSGLGDEAVRAIIAAQASRAQRLALADTVIVNQGLSLDELHTQVDDWVVQARRQGWLPAIIGQPCCQPGRPPTTPR